MNTIKLSNISVAQMRKILKSQGFVYDHTTGDHEIYVKQGALRPCTLPLSCDPVKEGVVRSLMRTMCITRKEMEQIMLSRRKK